MALGHSGPREAVSQAWGHRDRSCSLTPNCCPQPSQAAGGGTPNHGPGPQVPDGLRGGGSDLSGPFWAMVPSLSSPSPQSQAVFSPAGGREGPGASKLCLLSLSQLCSSLLSSTPSSLCHLHCLPHCALTPHPNPCYTPPAVNVGT